MIQKLLHNGYERVVIFCILPVYRRQVNQYEKRDHADW